MDKTTVMNMKLSLIVEDMLEASTIGIGKTTIYNLASERDKFFKLVDDYMKKRQDSNILTNDGSPDGRIVYNFLGLLVIGLDLVKAHVKTNHRIDANIMSVIDKCVSIIRVVSIDSVKDNLTHHFRETFLKYKLYFNKMYVDQGIDRFIKEKIETLETYIDMLIEGVSVNSIGINHNIMRKGIDDANYATLKSSDMLISEFFDTAY